MVSIAILTKNCASSIGKILDMLDPQKYEIFIIDSSSTDDTIKISKSYQCNIKIYPQSEFNHGFTRERTRKLVDSDIIVFLTHDAIPTNHNVIDKLIEPIKHGKAEVSYARQIPRDCAHIFESFPRTYNYNSKSHIRSIKDVDQYGVYTFFCSNSCAAWSNTALDKVGGFKNTLTNEDYFTCAELLVKGFRVAYVSDAIVKHSHNYSLKEEFQRMFDTGYVRAERSWIQDLVGSDSKRGANYFIDLIKILIKNKPYLIPYAFFQTAVKYIGYKVGYNSLFLPKWFKKICSEQKYYWNSKFIKK